MRQMLESYRRTMEKLKERNRELERRMAALLPGVERDGLEARSRILQQELREMSSTAALLEEYLAARGESGQTGECRVSALVPREREEAVS